MENVRLGKETYKVVIDPVTEPGCEQCEFHRYKYMCDNHEEYGFPHCVTHDCHFELLKTET